MIQSVNNSHEISRYFLSMAPISLILDAIERTLTWGEKDQEELIQQTICHPSAIKFPPSATYQRRFLKAIIKQVENNHCSVSETIYCHYAALIANPTAEDPYYFVTYLLDSNNAVTLQETNCLVYEGTTGLKTWQAGKYLAEWCVEHASMLKNRAILELGCGLGLTGLVICKLCAPASYSFTDCHPTVLKLVQKNISLNLSADNKQLEHPGGSWVPGEKSKPVAATSHITDGPLLGEWSKGKAKCADSCYPKVQSFCLEWDLATEGTIKALEYDIILAADVLYDLQVVTSFVNILNMLLCQKPQSKALVACAVRNPETLDFFLNCAEMVHLKCIEADPPHSTLFCISDPISLRLFEIVLQNKLS